MRPALTTILRVQSEGCTDGRGTLLGMPTTVMPGIGVFSMKDPASASVTVVIASSRGYTRAISARAAGGTPVGRAGTQVDEGPDGDARGDLELGRVGTPEDRDDLHVVLDGEGLGEVDDGPVGSADAVDVVDQEGDL